MKKNKSNLLIPLIVIVVLIVVLGSILLRDNIVSLFKPRNAFTKVEGYPREVDSTKPIERTRTIVRSEQEFKDLIKKLFDDENKVPMPENDFSRNDLYVVTTDLNDTKGFRLKVRSMNIDDKNEFQAILERQKPGKTCINDAVSNVAMDIVKISKDIPEIDAERVDKIIDCK